MQSGLGRRHREIDPMIKELPARATGDPAVTNAAQAGTRAEALAWPWHNAGLGPSNGGAGDHARVVFGVLVVTLCRDAVARVDRGSCAVEILCAQALPVCPVVSSIS